MDEFYSNPELLLIPPFCFCRWNIRVCCDWFLCTGDDGSTQCFTSTHSCLRLLHLNMLNVKHVFTNLVMQFHEIIYLLMYLFHYFTYLINCDLCIYLIDLIITSFIQCLYFIFYLIYFRILFYFTFFFTFNKHTNLTNMVKKKLFNRKCKWMYLWLIYSERIASLPPITRNVSLARVVWRRRGRQEERVNWWMIVSQDCFTSISGVGAVKMAVLGSC